MAGKNINVKAICCHLIAMFMTPAFYRLPHLLDKYLTISSVTEFKQLIYEDAIMAGQQSNPILVYETPSSVRFRCNRTIR